MPYDTRQFDHQQVEEVLMMLRTIRDRIDLDPQLAKQQAEDWIGDFERGSYFRPDAPPAAPLPVTR